MRFGKLIIFGSVFRSGPRRRTAVVGRKVEVQLKIEPRTISALGPAGFHTQQLQEWNFTCKKCGEEIPSIFLSNTFKGLERKEELPSLERKSWDEAIRALLHRHLSNTFTHFWFQEAPSLSFRDVWFPWQLFQTCFTKPTLHAYTYVHAPCACATSPDINKQAGTHKHTFSMAKKTLKSFFQTRIQLVTDRTRFQNWSYFNCYSTVMEVKLLQCKEAISEAQKDFLSAVSYESV